MQVRVFTIRAIDADDGAVEELNSFLRAHRIASIDQQFVANGSNSCWCFSVTFVAANSPTPARSSKPRVDYREKLNERDFAVFASLRTLRKARAVQEGIPAYAIFTNEQLAEIATRRVVSNKLLAEIDGVGDARVQKYGDDFIAAVRQAESDLSPEENASDA